MVTSQKILLRVQLIVLATYFLVKFLMRPIIVEGNYGSLIKTFVLSYPNFCEAIVGSIAITYLLLIINGKNKNKRFSVKEWLIPIISVIVSGIYVLLQEFKIHSLGGYNVYDPYDVLFSGGGLIVSSILLALIKPTYLRKTIEPE